MTYGTNIEEMLHDHMADSDCKEDASCDDNSIYDDKEGRITNRNVVCYSAHSGMRCTFSVTI